MDKQYKQFIQLKQFMIYTLLHLISTVPRHLADSPQENVGAKRKHKYLQMVNDKSSALSNESPL